MPAILEWLDDFKEEFMGTFQEVKDAAARIGPGLDSVATEITKAADQLSNNPEFSAVADSLNAAADRLAGMRDSVDALVEVAGEDDVTPPNGGGGEPTNGGGTGGAEEPTP